MVKIFVVSKYITDPPKQLGAGRVKIAGGPLYPLSEVQQMLDDDNCLKEWTEKCRKDVDKWFEDDRQRVVDLLKSLKGGDYIDSEWCENGRGAVAACDAYSLRVLEVAPATGKTLWIEYFLKFAIAKTGVLVLLVSCHA
jgi:hypothetical protein